MKYAEFVFAYIILLRSHKMVENDDSLSRLARVFLIELFIAKNTLGKEVLDI